MYTYKLIFDYFFISIMIDKISLLYFYAKILDGLILTQQRSDYANNAWQLKHTPIHFCQSSRQLHQQHNRVPGVGIHRCAVQQLKFADTTSTKFVHCVGNELMKCRHYLPEVSLNDHGGWFLGAQLVGRCLPPRTCAYVCHFPPALL